MISHSDLKPFVCGYCGGRFTRKASLRIHVRRHTGENLLSCDKCYKKFTRKADLQKHMRFHAKLENAETEVPTSSSAEQMKTEPDGEISGGSEPNRELDSNPNLQANIEERHSSSSETEVSDESEDDNLSGSESENEDSDEDWREPRTRQSGVNSKVGRKAAKKAFSCPDCGKQFVRKQMFQKHMAGHLGEKSSRCSVEKNHSRGKRNGDSQTRFKPGRKYFTCDNCGEIFKKLATHMTIHKGVKPFACSDCGRCFRLKSDLKGHMTTHLDVKSFGCGYCENIYLLPLFEEVCTSGRLEDEQGSRWGCIFLPTTGSGL
uniref:C2H2-type domain-containing protein n=1 Tax=Poecilia mexicana TaxID=48701 RepID=A0A3B3XYS3_9TELE